MSKCETCKFDYDINSLICIGCSDNPALESHYVQKVDPLKNIFDGAPVFVSDNEIDWYKKYYRINKICYINGKTKWTAKDESTWKEIRLPTIAESPRNTWLAAPSDGKCPDGAEYLKVMIWEKGAPIPCNGSHEGRKWCWSPVEKFMIIDEGEF